MKHESNLSDFPETAIIQKMSTHKNVERVKIEHFFSLMNM